MLDGIVFGGTFLVFTTMIAIASTVIVVSLVFVKNPQAQGIRNPVVNSAVTSTTGVLTTLSGIPLALLRYFASHISMTVLLIICVLVNMYMSNNESQFLTELSPVYHRVTPIWINGALEPLAAVANAIYIPVIGVTNWFSYIFRSMLESTVRVLGSSGQSPFVIMKALLSIPRAIGSLGVSVVALFETRKGGDWMVNEFEMVDPITIVQRDLIAVVSNQANYLCMAVTPAVMVARDIVTSPYLARMIHHAVNSGLSVVQAFVRVPAPQYNSFDTKYLFQHLRGFSVSLGGVIDSCTVGLLNLAMLPLDRFGTIDLPSPSLGSGIGRTLAAVLTMPEILFETLFAIVDQQNVYDASDPSAFIRQADLGIRHIAAGANQIKHLLYTGTPGKQVQLKCEYWGYNFFLSENIKGSIESSCICEVGRCGAGGRCVVQGTCECDPGYINAIPAFSANVGTASKCVRTCQARGIAHQATLPPVTSTNIELQFKSTEASKCGTKLEGMSDVHQSAGKCLDSGYCHCHSPAVMDLRDGTCKVEVEVPLLFRVEDPDQKPKQSWNNENCNGLITHAIGPAAECAFQSAALATLGAIHVGYDLFREVVYRFPSVYAFDELLQTMDGVWYPRFESITCEYRKEKGSAFERSMDPANCMCDPPAADDVEGLGYDPYCARPTLNANVYSHMDAFAFYAGRSVPISGIDQLSYVFVGGTGAQFGFLADTLGVWATSGARAGVEFWRIASHIFVSIHPFFVGIGNVAMQTGHNMLQKPENCEWGLEFDGPVRPYYTSPQQWPAAVESYRAWLDDKDGKTGPCGDGCTTGVRDRIAALAPLVTLKASSASVAIGVMNGMHAVQAIHARNKHMHKTHEVGHCKARRYVVNAKYCRDTNKDPTCMCNPAIPDEEGELTCQCMAFYPTAQATAGQGGASYKSEFFARFYSGKFPWCNAMMMEWKFFYQMSAAVAIQNLFARLASSQPLANELDSDCFAEDATYEMDPNNLLTRLYQPSDKYNGYAFTGGRTVSPRDLVICNALRKLKELRWIKDGPDGTVVFAGKGMCIKKDEHSAACIEGPRDLRLLALDGFPNPYVSSADLFCYQRQTRNDRVLLPSIFGSTPITTPDGATYSPVVPIATIRSVIINKYGGNFRKFCDDAIRQKLRVADGFESAERANKDWIDVVEYRSLLSPYRIETGVGKLHPKTCGYIAETEQLVYQPCRTSCHTPEGYDMCWCNSTVYHNPICNQAAIARVKGWAIVDKMRAMTTSFMSTIGFIPNGIASTEIPELCAIVRTYSLFAAQLAAMLTLASSGGVANEIRSRLARLFFNLWEAGLIGVGSEGNLDATKLFLDPAERTMVNEMLSSTMSTVLGTAPNKCASGPRACAECTTHSDCNPKTGVAGAGGWSNYCYPKGECPEHAGNPKWGFTNKRYDPIKRCVDTYTCDVPECRAGFRGCNTIALTALQMIASEELSPYKVSLAQVCVGLGGMQNLIFGLGTQQGAAAIIPMIMKLVDTVATVLQDTLMPILILMGRVVGNFINVLVDPSLRAVREFFAPAFELLWVYVQWMNLHWIKLIQMGVMMVPDPVGTLLQMALGPLCSFVVLGIGTAFDVLNMIPGVNALLPSGMDFGSSTCPGYPLNGNTDKVIEQDYARRRLYGRDDVRVGSNHTEYFHMQERLDWTGDTLCARYGRRDEPPENDFAYMQWQDCVAGREHVALVRHMAGVDWVPWNLYDDWRQPLKFVALVGMAGYRYVTEGEHDGGLHARAAVELIQSFRASDINVSPIDAMRHVITHKYPEHVKDPTSIGHHLLHVAAVLEDTPLPSVNLKGISELPGHLHKSVTRIMEHVRLPHSGVTKTTRRSDTPHRRLQQASVGEAATAPTITVEDTCATGGKSCLDCEVLTDTVDGIVEVSAATNELFSVSYPRVVNYFLDTLAHWESTNTDPNYAIFPNGNVPYRPKPELVAQPTPQLVVGGSELIEDVDWKQAFKAFFTQVDDRSVPVFGHSLWYYLQYPLRPCDDYRMNYAACGNPKYSAGDSVLLTGRVMMGFWITGWLTGLQLPLLIQAPLLSMLFMIFRYDWVPRCLPMLPTCLLMDMQYLLSQLTPGCMCQLVPALVVNPDMCTSEFCSDPGTIIVYQNCPARKLGVAWPILYLLRWQVPSLFIAMFTSASSPFSGMQEVPTIAEMLDDINSAEPLTGLDRTCCTLRIMDVILLLLALRVVLVLLEPVVRGVIQSITACAGSITMTLPFLLLRVPEMVKEKADQDGFLMRGWERM